MLPVIADLMCLAWVEPLLSDQKPGQKPAECQNLIASSLVSIALAFLPGPQDNVYGLQP